MCTSSSRADGPLYERGTYLDFFVQHRVTGDSGYFTNISVDLIQTLNVLQNDYKDLAQVELNVK